MGPLPSNARLRVTYASPDAPVVDVCVNGTAAFSNATFPSATDYATVEAGSLQARVVAVGTGCEGAAVIDETLSLTADTDKTVVVVNVLDAIEAVVLTDDNAAPSPGMARLRFVHASPDAPTVDITLTDGTTLFDNVAFKETGDYIEAAAGTLDLEVRDETGATVVLTLTDVTLDAGAVYTVYAIGLLTGEPTLDAFITVDNQ